MVDAGLSVGKLLVTGDTRGGEAIVERFAADDYMVKVDVDLNSGIDANVFFRRIDTNNAYVFSLYDLVGPTQGLKLSKLVNGKYTRFDSGVLFGSTLTAEIKVNGTSIKVWIDGSLKFDVTDSAHAAGGVAFGGTQAKFDNLKIGYDNNSDDDIDDPGDDVVISEDFGSTSVTVSHDKAGNLIDDGVFRYTYDAWNRLVKVQSSLDSGAVTIQTAEFDAMGCRIKKVVTNAGEYDGTVVYFYEGQKILEMRDGSGNMVQQFIHGTRYIDELVMARVKNKGEFYVHQDANWNVVALTDLGGSAVERYVYTPYGEVTVHQETSFGDRDGDGVVDSADKGTPGTTCTGTVAGACRILDLDFDGDYDSADATLFDSLPQGLARHPGRPATAVSQPFGHQGLLYEPELEQYQGALNRPASGRGSAHAQRGARHQGGVRHYAPRKRRFLQRNPLTAYSGSLDGGHLYAFARANPMNGPQFKCELALWCWEAFGWNPFHAMHCEWVVYSTMWGQAGAAHGGAVFGCDSNNQRCMGTCTDCAWGNIDDWWDDLWEEHPEAEEVAYFTFVDTAAPCHCVGVACWFYPSTECYTPFGGPANNCCYGNSNTVAACIAGVCEMGGWVDPVGYYGPTRPVPGWEKGARGCGCPWSSGGPGG